MRQPRDVRELSMLALARANARFLRHFERQVEAYQGLVERRPPDFERFPGLCTLFADVVISEITSNGAPSCMVASPPDPFAILEIGDNVFRNCTSAEWVELKILEKSVPAVDVKQSDLEADGRTLRFDAFAEAKNLCIRPAEEREGLVEIRYKLSWKFPNFAASGGTGGGADMKIQDP